MVSLYPIPINTESIPRADWWNEFFKEAGIPVGISASYAVTFCEHRISADQIHELSPQLLRMMNIQALGHIMSILKYAGSFSTVCGSIRIANRISIN